MNNPPIDRGGIAIMSISIDLTNEGIVGKEVTGAATGPYIIPALEKLIISINLPN